MTIKTRKTISVCLTEQIGLRELVELLDGLTNQFTVPNPIVSFSHYKGDARETGSTTITVSE